MDSSVGPVLVVDAEHSELGTQCCSVDSFLQRHSIYHYTVDGTDKPSMTDATENFCSGCTGQYILIDTDSKAPAGVAGVIPGYSPEGLEMRWATFEC